MNTSCSSVVIDYLYSKFHQHSTIGIACLYADYKDQDNQTLVNILGSFVHQLLTTTTEPIPAEEINQLQDIESRRELGAEDWLALLQVQLHQLTHAYICIDALDEFEPKVRQKLLSILMELCTKNMNVRLFLTGRHYIESEVQKCFQAAQNYTVVISASQQDIEVFLRQQIMDDPYAEDAMDETLEKDIIDTIVKRSQGMLVHKTQRLPIVVRARPCINLLFQVPSPYLTYQDDSRNDNNFQKTRSTRIIANWSQQFISGYYQ